MEATITEMKLKAVEVLEKLGVNKYFRFIFERENKLFLFDSVYGVHSVSLIDEGSVFFHKVQDVERKTHCKVYAVLHSRMFFGETYDFLLISNYLDDFDEMYSYFSNRHHLVYAYCFNVSFPKLSESGRILLADCDGFIARVA